MGALLAWDAPAYRVKVSKHETPDRWMNFVANQQNL